ncbi:thioesterase family protein [Natribacillus halophilus]|uniref:Acyl-CoA thioester hydrolase n=1 Tax=Natribacillus halophilus TaxID=549003 RepID=A0A1G8LJZ8_9BACI|nr:thioesterase family protein [Natribacillus halophilus]SDI56001.1 acyl-CoA thioester hydrolase [Natribacillus halophilus]
MNPKEVWNGTVLAEWVDYNGHMNDAAYAQVFSTALDALMDHIGLDEKGRFEEGYTMFTLETHLKYLAEATEGQMLRVFVTLLDLDPKRMHLWFVMKNDQDDTIATSEQMTMGMDQDSGRPAPFPEKVNEAVSRLPLLARDDWPASANQPMGIKKKK